MMVAYSLTIGGLGDLLLVLPSSDSEYNKSEEGKNINEYKMKMYVYTCLIKSDCLGCVCCFALFVCLTLLASFYHPSHLSLKYICRYCQYSLLGMSLRRVG